MQGKVVNNTKKPPIVAPIYTFAFTQLFFALIGMTINDGYDVFVWVFFGLITSGIAAIISLSVRAATRKPEVQEQVVQQAPSTGNSQVDEVIREGQELLRGLEVVKGRLQNPIIINKTNDIIIVSHRILDRLRKTPELHSTVKRFTSYYLPTTTKLVTNYSYMESQGVRGENITNTMIKIENTLETLKNAYQSQLDSLFSHVAIDLETDIQVLENILKTEGLVENENTFRQ